MANATDWQPIETAPKDEDEWEHPRVLLTDGEKVAAGHWKHGAYWTNEAEIEWLGDDGAFHEEWRPTHWIPLPEPPALSSNQGETTT